MRFLIADKAKTFPGFLVLATAELIGVGLFTALVIMPVVVCGLGIEKVTGKNPIDSFLEDLTKDSDE